MKQKAMALIGNPSHGCGEFEFDLVTALFEQITKAFHQITPVPLTAENVTRVGRRSGVYGLTHKERIVYVGKADDDVQSRLAKHRRQLSGRVGILPEQVQFRCVYLAKTWDPFKPEDSLQNELKPSWNEKGFGPNDPGRNRDNTVLLDDNWHVLYPLDPDWCCAEIQAGVYKVLTLLRKVARSTPFWVRFQGNRRSRRDQTPAQYEQAQEDFAAASDVVVARPGLTVRELLVAAVRALPHPDEWQLTLLPSHILLYRERNAVYPRGVRLWPVADAD
ncbi:MAG: hypothetical protein JXA57_05825 [Armatimonadetes bacterium]|nr:hypothetical protein [Armatimonadota bacterium]